VPKNFELSDTHQILFISFTFHQETGFKALATATESEVVGRPISVESWRLSSNNAPCDAPISQPAIALARASGKPKLASVVA
jgi:hypothetical protein